MQWAGLQTASVVPEKSSMINSAPYAIQLVRQINYGPQESIRYFIPPNEGPGFTEITEDDLVASNFEKLNSFVAMNTPCV